MAWNVTRKDWGSTPAGERVESILVHNEDSGMEVEFLSLGASINRVRIPDRDGNIGDIHYGRAELQEALSQKSYMGSMVGRVASLIGFGRFELDGKIYELSKNMMGVHTQHGGYEGFDSKVWQCDESTGIEVSENEVRIHFTYTSPDGEEGFPGTLQTSVEYYIRNYELEWHIRAETDAPTIVNITNHAYWNLDGLYRPIDDLILEIYASHYLNMHKAKLILNTLTEKLKLKRHRAVTMSIEPLENLERGKLSFSRPNRLGDIFKKIGDIDHNFISDLACTSTWSKKAVLSSPSAGRRMEIWSTEPAMVVYSGNAMEGLTSFNKPVHKHYAICLETMKPTNSIQHPDLRDWVIVRPEKPYTSRTMVKFEIES